VEFRKKLQQKNPAKQQIATKTSFESRQIEIRKKSFPKDTKRKNVLISRMQCLIAIKFWEKANAIL
jgi:hypothetical protein